MRKAERMEPRNLLKISIIGLLLISLSFGIVSCARGVGTLGGILEEVPDGAISFDYWNTEAMAADEDLHPLLDKWKADNETQLDAFGIESANVQHFLHFSMDGNDSLVIRGDLNRDQVRDRLQKQAHLKGDWRKVEVWESPDGQYGLAITEDSFIGGRMNIVRECINVRERESTMYRRLYDDQDVRDVVDRLPSGIIVLFDKQVEEPPYEGLVASGASFSKKERNRLTLRLVYKFNEPDDAGNALQGIRDELDKRYTGVEAKQDGRFVIVTAEVEIEDLIT